METLPYRADHLCAVVPEGHPLCKREKVAFTAEWERDVRAFFADNKIDLGGRTLQQYLEQLRVAVAFQQREAEPLAAYLSRQKSR